MIKCFYHSIDLDGRCSGAIIKKMYPDCKMYGINYGDVFPWGDINPMDTVIMVDFALQPFSDMVKLAKICDLVWIDHHKSAIEEFDKLGNYDGFKDFHLSLEKAACELVWEYFFDPNSTPLPVYYLGRYDIWKHHEIPLCLEFQYGMKSFNSDPENIQWRMFLDQNYSLYEGAIATTINNGKVILEYQKKQNADYVKAFSFEVEFEGYRAIAVNMGMTSSQLFESIFDPKIHDIMMPFCYRNGQWTISLYTPKGNIDVSAIAKKYGGGGHRGASGFQINTLPFKS